MSILPQKPFDSQEFIDAFRVKWRFDGDLQCWKNVGTVPDIPIVDEEQPGLMSAKLKGFVDSIPAKGGGFGIIVDPKLSLRTENNPDGVIFGDVELVSESLDIDCVVASGALIPIDRPCQGVEFVPEVDLEPPGFDINFSEKFLSTMCVEIPGAQGPAGDEGPKGDKGETITGDGPRGEKGDQGRDAVEAGGSIKIRIEDVFDIFDTAVVNLELDRDNATLNVVKGKMRIPEIDTPADQVIASPIFRSINFPTSSGFEFKISKGPDSLPEDVLMGTYPQSFTPDSKAELLESQVVGEQLSAYVTKMTDFYQEKLDEIADEYDKEIEDFIKQTDEAGRQKLDSLVAELSNCEFDLPIEFCVGIEPCPGFGGDIAGTDITTQEANALSYSGNSPAEICSLSDMIAGTEFCSTSVGEDLGYVIIKPNSKNRLTGQGSDLPGGLYMIIYISGSFFDSDNPQAGYFIWSEAQITNPSGRRLSHILDDSMIGDRFEQNRVESQMSSLDLLTRSISFVLAGGETVDLFGPAGEKIAGEIKFRVIRCEKCLDG